MKYQIMFPREKKIKISSVENFTQSAKRKCTTQLHFVFRKLVFHLVTEI